LKPDDIQETIFNEIKEKLYSHFGTKLVKVILFGSFARGDYESDSDVDILLVVNDYYLQAHDEYLSELTISLLNKTDLYFAFYTESEKFFDENKYRLPFLKNVVEEGKVIYG